jgi:Second Messenger Oligonucleotide or Dinucleotide Synthetase domain
VGYVDEAFEKLRKNLEITQTERDFASRKQNEIRNHVSSDWDLSGDFLTGSYKRETKTKRLKDVDIFIVIDTEGDQGSLRDHSPSRVLRDLRTLLEDKYDDVTEDGFACTVEFGSDEEIASFDVVPSYERDGGGYQIPDARRGRWIDTDPTVHADMTTAKNEECGKAFVPFVKMIKGMNREFDEPIKPPFLLEVMAHRLVEPPFGRYQDEIRWFLASAVDQIGSSWPDPAGVGPNVNDTWDASDRDRAKDTFSEWLEIAEHAVWLEDDGQERAAVEEWRKLFGSRMPRP